MSAEYNSILIAGVELEQKKVSVFVTKYNENTGVAYQKECREDRIFILGTDINIERDIDCGAKGGFPPWLSRGCQDDLVYFGDHPRIFFLGCVIKSSTWRKGCYSKAINPDEIPSRVESATLQLREQTGYSGEVKLFIYTSNSM